MAVSASLRALLDQAIDYAGMFPPCALALEPALRNQASYVRSSEAWMLNGFVLPVEQFDAARQFFAEFDPHHPLRVAALGPKTTKADAFLDGLHNMETAISSFSRYDVDLVSISHFEMFLPEDVDSPSLKAAGSIVSELPVFLEAPPERAEQTIALIAGHNSQEDMPKFGYKLLGPIPQILFFILHFRPNSASLIETRSLPLSLAVTLTALPSMSLLPVAPFLIPTSSFLLFPSEPNRLEFRSERLCLLGCEFDQRRPHRPPCRIVRVDCNGLFQRSDHRRKLSATKHLTHDIQF